MQSFIEEKLGFSTIKKLLLDRCHGIPGRQSVENLTFSSDFETVRKNLGLADDLIRIINSGQGFTLDDYADLRTELAAIKIEGTFLNEEIFLDLRYFLNLSNNCVSFIKKLLPDDFPYISITVQHILPENRLTEEIDKIFDPHGNIYSNASATLAKIRKEIKSRSTQVDKRMIQLLQLARNEKLVSSDSEIAIRNGRMVIPVPAANKRKIKGIIHDESATGSTVYIEPTEIFELNNHIRELEIAERREIIQILINLTSRVRPDLHNIFQLYKVMAEFDKLNAIAGFAIDLGAAVPQISAKKEFAWQKARHPLLMLSLRKQDKDVVPLDIELTDKKRILIISGPNAGGKSVCLKTTGLIQYMLQCGLPVPMNQNSEAGIFEEIFIDIGDQQSIENDLSTYSSHLINIKYLIENARPGVLFLIDEFGSGTEPQSGGAIAEAVIEILEKKGASGVITTHYANLKLLAAEENGILNGAMLFDTKNLKPLYTLKTGNPGSSFAFEIARSIEFPSDALDLAAEKAGTDLLNFDRQIQNLEADKIELSRKEKQLRMADEMLNQTIEHYKKLSDEIESKKKEIIAKAQEEAGKLLKDINSKIENTIKEIRVSQAEKEITRRAREEVEKIKSEISVLKPEKSRTVLNPVSQPEKTEPSIVLLDSTDYSVGDNVVMKGHDEVGEIAEITATDALIHFKTVSLRIKLSNLQKVKSRQKNQYNFSQTNKINDINARLANFRITIDLRGFRAEEALDRLQKYIDEAELLHVSEVQILHGKGNGVLRNVLQAMLAKHHAVGNFCDAAPEMGGSGITIVTLK